MKLTSKRTLVVLAGLSAISASYAQIVIDGTMSEAAYGLPVAVQNQGTDYGDNGANIAPWASGTELNTLFVAADAGNLYVGMGGNIETNFNKFMLWFDSKSGGQNTIDYATNNPGWDFDFIRGFALESGGGFTFDSGFTADYAVNVTNGDSGPTPDGIYELYASYFVIGVPGFDPASGAYLGTAGFPNVGGVLTGGSSNPGINVTVDNSNAAGVDGSGGGASNGAGVLTGAEWKIPFSALGVSGTPRDIKVLAMATGGGGGFASNQLLPPHPVGTAGLGSYSGVDLNSYAGNQFYTLFPSVKGSITLNGRAVTSAIVAFGSNAGSVDVAGGVYTASGPIKGGVYTLRIKAHSSLVKEVSIDTTNGPITGINVNLINGDINGDNEIGAADFSALAAAYDAVVGDANFSAAADLNGDEEVGAADFSLLAANYDEVGDGDPLP